MKLSFYFISEAYIAYLRNYETRVEENKNQGRPYVGVVCEVKGVRYFAPLTSPKEKHKTMKNTKDFRKIAGGKYGAINFCNMIPVSEEALIPIDFNAIADKHYRRLLQNQYNALREDAASVMKTASALRDLVFSDNSKLSLNDRRIKERCCNFPLLESVYQNWKQK